ncbi:MbcA/ParS/Xre antitoxin family protein [Halomonas sp. AOP42-B2-16]|uniref:MbcA/ParS/Xre antitoxin family protein n=1 Tax=Halomonas sp. AOP42-B2-16 TaxID=3457673 RepID=UPI004034C175
MATMSGEIVAYLRGGYSLTIPEHFFLRRVGKDVTLAPPEENDAVCVEVEAWLRETLTKHSATLAVQDASTVRPSRFDLLLDQCDPQASKPDTGHEVLDLLNDKNAWAAAIQVFGGKEEAKRWMTSPLDIYEGLSPVEMLQEDPQRVYDSGKMHENPRHDAAFSALRG